MIVMIIVEMLKMMITMMIVVVVYSNKLVAGSLVVGQDNPEGNCWRRLVPVVVD